MTNHIQALPDAKQSCTALKSAIARLNELDELMAQGRFAEADQLMAELDAELKAK